MQSLLLLLGKSINQSINQSFICLNTDITEKQHK